MVNSAPQLRTTKSPKHGQLLTWHEAARLEPELVFEAAYREGILAKNNPEKRAANATIEDIQDRIKARFSYGSEADLVGLLIPAGFALEYNGQGGIDTMILRCHGMPVFEATKNFETDLCFFLIDEAYQDREMKAYLIVDELLSLVEDVYLKADAPPEEVRAALKGRVRARIDHQPIIR